MDQRGCGQQSPFWYGQTSSTPPPPTTASNGRRQMSPSFFGNASSSQSSISLTDPHYPTNGVYYSNPQTPTMNSPPPGFAAVQNLSGMLPPGYQHAMQNAHLQNVQQGSQNFYPGGFPQQQQVPIFNNNLGPHQDVGSHHYHHHDVGHSFQQNQKHQEYRGLGNENMFNNNVNSYGGIELETAMRQTVPVNFTGVNSTDRNSSPIDKTSTQTGGIKPLIDNIVGSMVFNGVNGAYTHFGPLGGVPPYPSDYERHGEGHNMEFVLASPVSSTAGQGKSSANYTTSDVQMNDQRQGSPILRNPGSVANHIVPQIPGRSSTPCDPADNTSRPHTPNKPSYSEILAKQASQGLSGTGTPTPTPTYRKPASAACPSKSIVSKSSAKENQIVSSTRKPDCTSVSSGSSANSSSSASLSSSPVAKQKTLSQTIMGRLFTAQSAFGYGKENTTSAPPKPAYYRTPVSTPTHQRKSVTEIKSEDRKVLASQNSGNTKHQKAKKFNNGSTSSLHSEIVDDQAEQTTDGDWKTYSNRNKHPNRSNQPSNSSSKTLATRDDFESNAVNSVDPHDEENIEQDDDIRETPLNDKKSGNTLGQSSNNNSSTVMSSSNTTSVGGGGQSRKTREKERPKNKKDCRKDTIRRFERILYLWAATMISVVAWLVKLVTDVCTLSISVGSTLMEDLYSWWVNKAVPGFLQQVHRIEETFRVSYRKLKQSLSWNKWPFRRKVNDENSDMEKNSEDLLAALGPEKNIQITNADETLKRLLSCKGQDPYSILGLRSDSSDETIRRYYKRQAVQVHPDKNVLVGAEEAFKILGRAFEFIGEPSKRQEYHNKLLEAHAKEQVYGEIGKLLEQLRKKMEIATSSIRCTKCNLRHKKNKTDRPLFAARFCAQCNIHHAAREGELWAESKGWFGMSWNYFTCMDCHIWEINEWAKCQKKNLEHIKADSHCVMYRLVAGGGNGGQSGQQSSGVPGQGAEGVDPEDDWDSLINNLCKTGGVPGSKAGDHFYQQGNGAPGNFGGSGGGNTSSAANGTTAGRKRKGKRK